MSSEHINLLLGHYLWRKKS